MSWVAPKTDFAVGDILTAAEMNDIGGDLAVAADRACGPPWGPVTLTAPTANRAYYVLVDVTPGLSPGTFAWYCGTSSGNIDVGIYADSGGQPGSALWRAGGFASPGTGRQGKLISAGSPTSLTIDAAIVWLAIAADNGTVSLPYNGYLRTGLAYIEDTAYPLPSTATPTGASDGFHLGLI